MTCETRRTPQGRVNKGHRDNAQGNWGEEMVEETKDEI